MKSLYKHLDSENKSKGFMQKLGQLGNLQSIILTLVVVGVLIGAGFFILQEFLGQAEQISDDGQNSSAWQGINDTIDAMQTIPELLGLIVLVAVVGIILAIVLNTLPRAGGGGA